MLACPECCEPAQESAPTVEGYRHLRFSHMDGEPLCPVMTDTGYQPAAYPCEASDCEEN